MCPLHANPCGGPSANFRSEMPKLSSPTTAVRLHDAATVQYYAAAVPITRLDHVPQSNPSGGPIRLLPLTPSFPVCVSVALGQPREHHSKRAMDLVGRMTLPSGAPLWSDLLIVRISLINVSKCFEQLHRCMLACIRCQLLYTILRTSTANTTNAALTRLPLVLG